VSSTAAGAAPTLTTPLKGIPDALRALWRQCCPEEGDVSRSLTVNFVAVVTQQEEAELRVILPKLVKRLPCRAFLLIVDDDVQKVQAQVTGATRGTGKARAIVLEQIELRLPWSWFSNIAGVVRPLLVNDLSSHLWWGTSFPTTPRSFEVLADLVDHAVVDSGRFAMPALELEMLRSRHETHGRLTDLTWLRLSPWRRALAEGFERLTWQPGMAVTATIRGGSGMAAIAAPTLLGKWLEQRVAAEVVLEDATAAPAAEIESLELRVGDAVLQASIIEPHRIEVHVTTNASCYLPFTVAASRGSSGDLLAAAIDMA
jgi:glucose-6-phosphate dehydrogenase assembly protein OpcA